VAQQNQLLAQVYRRNYIDSVSATTDTDINRKQGTLQVNSGTGQQLVTTNGGTTLRNILSVAPLSIIPQAGYLQLEADCYSTSEGDARYWRKTEDLLQVNHPSATRYIRLSADHTSNTQMRYRDGSMLIRRVNSSNTSTTVLSLSGTNPELHMQWKPHS